MEQDAQRPFGLLQSLFDAAMGGLSVECELSNVKIKVMAATSPAAIAGEPIRRMTAVALDAEVETRPPRKKRQPRIAGPKTKPKAAAEAAERPKRGRPKKEAAVARTPDPRGPLQPRIETYLREHDQGSPKEIAAALDVPAVNVSMKLGKMLADGRVQNFARGAWRMMPGLDE